MSRTKEAYIEWLNSAITDEEWARLEQREAEIVYVDGSLQDIIDIANADYLAEEWQEFWLDQAWMAGGL